MIQHKVTSLRLAAKDVATPIESNAIKNLTFLDNLKIIHTGAGVNCPVRGLPSGLTPTKLSEMLLRSLLDPHERGSLGRCKRGRRGLMLGLMRMRKRGQGSGFGIGIGIERKGFQGLSFLKSIKASSSEHDAVLSMSQDSGLRTREKDECT